MKHNIQSARKRLDILTNVLIYRPQQAVQYTEQSVKDGFKALGYDSDIQNTMANEYQEFINTYIIKNKQK
jgi:hypothetical protein